MGSESRSWSRSPKETYFSVWDQGRSRVDSEPGAEMGNFNRINEMLESEWESESNRSRSRESKYIGVGSRSRNSKSSRNFGSVSLYVKG